MADRRLTALTELTTVADDDWLYIVDVSDTTHGPDGTSKKISKANVITGVEVSTLKTTGLASSQLLRVNAAGTAVEVSGKVAPSGAIVGTTDTQTLINKTLTAPVINGSVTGTGTPPLTWYSANFHAPRGFLLNGRINPSVSSNNLTVALQTMDGSTPSAANPVYCRVGNEIMAITSALSLTLNAGTNWFNSGRNELAGLEVDYFVYLANASGTPVLGLSRIVGYKFSEFSGVSTENRFLAKTTGTLSPNSPLEIIGRFAATLSSGTAYNWSVPVFDSENLIQTPIKETRWLQWLPTWNMGTMTFTGVSYSTRRYQINGNNCILSVWAFGTLGGTAQNTIEVTLPINSSLRYTGSGCHLPGSGSGYETCSVEIWSNFLAFSKYDRSNFTLGVNRNFAFTGIFNTNDI